MNCVFRNGDFMPTQDVSTGRRPEHAFRIVSSTLVTWAVILFALTPGVQGQSEKRFTISAGGGLSPLVGDISRRLDNGWHVTVGGGLNITRYLSATLDYSYNGFGVSQRVLSEAQVPGGNSHLWFLTVNPKVRLSHSKKFDPYLVGGVGYYRRTLQFTRPTLIPVLVVDPFFGDVFNTIVPADTVIGSITRDGVGGSGGAGFELKLPSTALKFYTEARYHYADTGRIPTRMVPVTFGFRW